MVWNPGKQLFGRRYIIERQLGRGGVGITYLAKNKQGQLRVIKTLREEILNDSRCQPHQTKLKQDFKEEALRLALCRHPHIVEVENVFDDGDLPCMAMEYIQGEDLYKRITEKGALPEAEALQYIRQIGDALILVHEKGLLHRDLKPSNIMMRAGKPEAVLIDFGLARQFISGTVQQHTQSLTPGYAPPEQYAPIEERGEYIDVYALAATLYSLLTGQLPMPAPARLQNFTMQPPKDLNPSVSDRVNEAIMRGMALNYKFRPQSVQEWFDLLGFTTPNNWECIHTIPDISGTFAITPNENMLAIVAGRGINVLELQTGKFIRNFSSNLNSIKCIAFSKDGRILACVSGENIIKLFQFSTGKEILTLSGHSSRINCIAFSPDGRILAAGDNKTIKLWEVTTGRQIYNLSGHSHSIEAIAFSPDGRILAAGSDKTIRLWGVNTGREVYTFSVNSHSIKAIAFSPNGQILASASSDDTIKLWEISTNWLQKLKIREIHTLIGHSNRINCIAFSPDGQILASASSDDTIKLWEVNTAKEVYNLSGHSRWIEGIAFIRDGRVLVSGSQDRTIKLWQVSNGREMFTLERNGFGEVKSIAISPDGKKIAGSSKIWDLKTGELLRSYMRSYNEYSYVAFSPDGQTIAIGSYNESILIRSSSTGEILHNLECQGHVSAPIAISPNGEFLATSAYRTYVSFPVNNFTDWECIQIWNLKTRKRIHHIAGHFDEVRDVAFSPDSQILASGSIDGAIKLWNVKTAELIRTINENAEERYKLSFQAYIKNPQLNKNIRNTESIKCITFNHQGSILASSSSTINTINLWNPITGQLIRTLSGHSSPVNWITFSPDGTILASGSKDKTIKLWQIDTGHEISTFSDHADELNCVTFSPDGHILASCDAGGNIKIWRRS
ncbi:PD40 domain-containing protein [Anabaena minutissima FACHB-250]|nr:PD40 domain-containing protein [Anabaena minutissima FACHB-250]